MDSRLYMKRAGNELSLARMIFKLSVEDSIQTEVFDMSKVDTYFSSVISHAYYCIFYIAKAYLFLKGAKTSAPSEHRKTFEAFKRFVDEGVVDVELLRIYEKMLVRADSLLGLYSLEKGKRGRFTYRKLPQANQKPALESLENAEKFYKHVYNLCRSP